MEEKILILLYLPTSILSKIDFWVRRLRSTRIWPPLIYIRKVSVWKTPVCNSNIVVRVSDNDLPRRKIKHVEEVYRVQYTLNIYPRIYWLGIWFMTDEIHFKTYKTRILCTYMHWTGFYSSNWTFYTLHCINYFEKHTTRLFFSSCFYCARQHLRFICNYFSWFITYVITLDVHNSNIIS